MLHSDEYVLLNPQHCLPEFLIHIQLVKNFESTAEAEVHHFYSTLQDRIENITRDFSSYSNPDSLESTPAQRYEWLQQVEQLLSPDRSECNEIRNEQSGKFHSQSF